MMKIRQRTVIELACDFCPATLTQIGETLYDAHWPAYRDGWRDRKKTRCPTCEAKRLSTLRLNKLKREAAPRLRLVSA